MFTHTHTHHTPISNTSRVRILPSTCFQEISRCSQGQRALVLSGRQHQAGKDNTKDQDGQATDGAEEWPLAGGQGRHEDSTANSNCQQPPRNCDGDTGRIPEGTRGLTEVTLLGRPVVLAYSSIRLWKDSLGFLFSGPSRCVTSALGTHTLRVTETNMWLAKNIRLGVS